MNNEKWRPVVGYEGLYEVSDCGRVKSLRRGIIMKLQKNQDGYPTVGLSRDGKFQVKTVHRLVALAFLDNPNNYPEVNHIDEVKQNNCVKNLEWCTHKHNLTCGTVLQRNEESNLRRRFVCVETGKVYKSQRRCAEEFGVCRVQITQVLSGRRKSAKGFHFEFID